MTRTPPISTLIPYTTLFRSQSVEASNNLAAKDQEIMLADKWSIDLMNSKKGAKETSKPMDIYWKGTFSLRANRVYALQVRSEEHTSELQSLRHLVCRLLLEK